MFRPGLNKQLVGTFRAFSELVHRQSFLHLQLPLLLRRTPLFQHINIQTTDRCTRRCAHCVFGAPDRPSFGEMSSALFGKILDDLAAIDFSGRVSLFEINEPLTDFELSKRLALVRERLPRCYLYLMTNGDLLDVGLARALFVAGLDELHVTSYDAESLQRNLSICRSAVGIGRTVHSDRTQHDGWVSRAGNLPSYYKGERSGPCELVFRQMVVKPDGSVVSCAHDLRGESVLGDAAQDSVVDIWFSRDFEELRRWLAKSDRSVRKLCSRCDYEGIGGFMRRPGWVRRWMSA